MIKILTLFTLFVFSFVCVAAGDYTPQECAIVGNLDSKIYHMPGQRYYGKMLRKNKRGDNRKCFKNEQDAIAASFRKSKV